MSKITEDGLQSIVRAKLTRAKVHVQRIETTTGSGVPDITAAWAGKEIWIELKIKIPAGILLRKYQHAWMMRRHMCGISVRVLAIDSEKCMYVWKYPFSVVAYGTAAKYVRITSDPYTFVPCNAPSIALLHALF